MHIKLKCWRGGIVLGMKIVWGGRNHVLYGDLEKCRHVVLMQWILEKQQVRGKRQRYRGRFTAAD